MKNSILSLAFFLFAIGSYAHEESPASPSQFEIEKNLLNQLYEESLVESKVDSTPYSSGIWVFPQISLLTPSEIRLSNNYFEIPYTENLNYLPLLTLGIGVPVLNWGGLSFSLFGRAGYSYKEGVQSVHSKAGPIFYDIVRLHWLPLSASTRLEYQFSSFQWIKPFVETGLGAQWLYQTGKLDGLEQGFWIPFYRLGGGVALFSSLEKRGDWFGGVQIGASLQNDFASEQKFSGWLIDIGANLVF